MHLFWLLILSMSGGLVSGKVDEIITRTINIVVILVFRVCFLVLD